MDYQVLLYYNYTKIEEPEEFAKNHLAFCKSLDLKGRILVAEEGINGTVSGTVENTTAYMEAMKADPRFADTMFNGKAPALEREVNAKLNTGKAFLK